MGSLFLLLHLTIYSIQPVEEGVPEMLQQSLLLKHGVENVIWQEWQGVYHATICYSNGETGFLLYDQFGNQGKIEEELGIIELPQHIYADLRYPAKNHSFISANRVSGFNDGDYYLIRLQHKREVIERLMK